MTDKLLFLGGSSASGTSTAADHLSHHLNLHCIHLDDFYIPFHHAIAAKAFARGPAIDLTRDISRSIVEKFLSENAACIIEGGWVQVSQASTFMEHERFTPIFCGYPNADAQQRWKQIKASPSHHWLKEYDDVKALEWLDTQISESQDYRDECNTYGVTFVDCSDLENATQNIVSRMYELLR